uniref:Uncharacterized protein n=1 Tax=Panagrolaimus sp. JU765 TaxID=591449 RepID=A0AC34QUW9_9BILA
MILFFLVLLSFALFILFIYFFWPLFGSLCHRSSTWKTNPLKMNHGHPYQSSDVFMFAQDEMTVCASQMDGTLPDLPENMCYKTVLAHSTPRIKGAVSSNSLETTTVLFDLHESTFISQ